MPPTLRDIAVACGVDVSTVSRALNGDSRVREATRKRISQQARLMGYQPNQAARSLVGARTHTIWFVTPSLNHQLEWQPAEQASHYLYEHNYSLAIALFHGESEQYEFQLSRLTQGVADGAIVIPGEEMASPVFTYLHERGFPVVFLDRYPEGIPQPIVTTANREAAAELVRRSIADGAEHLVLHLYDRNLVARDRREGALEEIGKHGIPFTLSDKPLLPPAPELDGKRIAFIANGQGYTHATVLKWRQELPHAVLSASVFDTWQGDPFPCHKVTTCIQDFRTMARHACDFILGHLSGSAPLPTGLHLVPPVSYITMTSEVG